MISDRFESHSQLYQNRVAQVFFYTSVFRALQDYVDIVPEFFLRYHPMNISGQISPGPPGPAEITGVTMTIFVIFGFLLGIS